MRNPATRSRDELNEFTEFVESVYSWETCFVKLRDGTLVRPVFVPAEDETCEDHFEYRLDKKMYIWNLDGTSITGRDYDMMEIVKT